MSQPSRLQALTQQTTGFHRNVYILFVSFFFFGFLIFGGVFQVLVNLMMVRLGYEPEFVGLLNGVGLLFISIGSVVAAVLGQRFASTTLLKFGFFFFFLGFLLFPLGNYLSSEIQRGWYLGTYALGNLMTAIYLVHANPLIMASTNDAERNRVFSFQAALMSIGGFMGAWFSGRLSGFFINQFGVSSDSPWPYTWTLLAAAGLAVVGVVASLFLVEAQTGRTQSVAEDAGERRVVEDPFPWKMILIVAVVISLRIVGELSARNFSNLYLDINFSLNPARIAYIFSVAQLFAVPAPLLAPMLMSRFGRHAVFNWATAGVAGCVVLMAMAGHWIMVAISYFFLLSLAQIARPAITIISMSSVTPKWQASMSSSNLIAIGLSGLAASLMAGLMIGSIGFRAFYLTAAAITLAGVVVFWFNFLKGQEAQ